MLRTFAQQRGGPVRARRDRYVPTPGITGPGARPEFF